ncbi:MAG: cytochrome c, partial [Acidobacteriaceae bacterium]|nr:cytochrome c [Acidobacteriaceae bacterium]
NLADPSDTAYVPRPEWYFLFLFQLLKFFAGPFEIVGTVILPSMAILALILVPFVDRRRVQQLTRRVVAISIAGAGLAAWTGLTAAAIVTTPKQLPAVDYSGPTDWLQLAPSVLAHMQASAAASQGIPEFAIKGAAVYEQKHCGSCHAVNGVGAPIAPSLNGLSRRRNASWVEQHFSEPNQLSPGTFMPRFQLASDDMANLTAYLLALPPR